MVDVNEKNFWHWLPLIEASIKTADFVSIDLEFLGLPSSSHPKAVSLFDSPAQRYEKLTESVRRFPPCQLGLACFRETEKGYEVEVFCISLFKRLCKRVFSFSLGAMSFLSHHNFDFNKFVSEGITYSNKNEVAKLRKEIMTGEIDYDTFTDGLDQRLLLLKSRVLMEARDVPNESDDGSIRGDSVRLAQPVLIELCSKHVTDDGEEPQREPDPHEHRDAFLWERPLTSLEASLTVFVLSEEYPHLEFQIDQYRTLLYVAERPLIFRNPTADKKLKKQLLKNVLNEISGVSQVFQYLAERKPTLVGHNSLLDIMYIYYCFEAELPDTYDKWKKAVSTTFPNIVDTKVLVASVQDKLFQCGVTDLSLQTLGNYFDSPSCGEILPFDTPTIVGGTHSQGVFDDSEHYHNAAFDALITGEVFIKLAHLYAHVRCSATVSITEPWPLRKLMVALRGRVLNRIPIPLIDTQHCYLAGDDPTGDRPDLIRVRRRRHLEWLHRLCPWEDLVGWTDKVIDGLMPPVVMSCEESGRMRDDLVRVLGAFRVELRAEDGGATAVIATNTANTYARVCSFFTAHDDYYLLDEAEGDGQIKSFEQRLCAWRQQKNAGGGAKEATVWRSSKRLMVGLSLSAVVAALFAARKLSHSK